MRVSLGADAARRNVDETITGLWAFANVLGLLTDIIGERTGAAGVTVDGLLIKDAGIPEAAVTAHEAALSIAGTQIPSLPEALVTAHEAALSIAGTQIPSLPEALVTAHEAALSILESQIVDGTILARLGSAEAVTAAWTFNQRILGKVDLFLDAIATAGANAFLCKVVGDATARYLVQGDGQINWGDGTLARDTNLFRNAANELKTDDAFTVGAALTAEKEILVKVNAIALTADIDDVSTGGVTCQRITADSVWTISGWAGGVDGRMIFVVNADDASNMGLRHEDASSVAANRMILPGAATLLLNVQEGVWLMYDGTSSRWRAIAHDI